MKRKTIIITLSFIFLFLLITAFLIFKNADNSQKTLFNSVEDIIKEPVGMNLGSTYADIAKEYGAFDEETQILEFNTEADEIDALKSGKIGSIINVELYLNELMEQNDDLTFFPQYVGFADYAIAFQKGSPLRDEFNKAMAELKSEGFDELLYDKWFNGNKTVILPDEQTEINKGTLRYWLNIGSPPLSFISDNGEITGYSVEFITHIVNRMGYDLEITECSFGGLIPALVSDKADLVGRSVVPTEERKKSVDFSDTFISTGLVLIVRKTDMSEEFLEQNGISSNNTLTFFESLKKSFENTFINENRWKLFLDGISVTMILSVASVLLGTVLGLVLYMIFIYEIKILNGIIITVNRWISGIPTVIFLMIMFYIIFKNSILDGIWISVFTFSIVFGINVFGLIKTGADTIGRGQRDSAADLGFSLLQTYTQIVLPQAVLNVMPLYRTKVIELLKATAVVGYIAVVDLTKINDLIRSRTFEAFFPLLASAVIYYLLGRIIDIFLKYAENKMKPENKKSKLLKGVKTK